MVEDELLATLQSSDDNEAWVATIAAWFEAHDLHYGHGTDNATDEAWWLLRHLQGWDEAAWSQPARSELAEALVRLALERTRSRTPLAYLINEAWFCGIRFYVDDRVLVPRSPFAEIIERCFTPWLALEPGDRLLDIGTGSGCIAIAAALHCPDAMVDATDTSVAALEVAQHNVALHGLQRRVRLHHADLFPGGEGRYRVIMSNPPYVPAAEYARLPAEYLHEPKQGLLGGPSGLEPAWAILRKAAGRLTDDGIVILEVGNQAGEFDAAVPGLEPIWVEFERGGHGVCVVQGERLRELVRSGELPESV
ncbi:MAG: 50S ribosomal protein L3 N(5)-glutamine methyltransferase [Gammaproteobacteria bacterium]|jgi:ribosomal protein L3 glutamine methyltransferase